MHIVILHGYILQGTGSNVYVANIAKAWKNQGHKVTILCQDRNAGKLPIVDEFILGTPDSKLKSPKDGTIRVIVPNINNLLPVYVMDEYKGYTVKTIQSMSDNEINKHINMVALVLTNIYTTQKVDKVFTNHALLSPAIAYKALKGTDIPYDIKIHGSAIEFSLVPTPRLMKYAKSSIENANNVYAGSQHIRNRIIEVFSSYCEIDKINAKIKIVSPGMDPSLFKISGNFSSNNSAFISKIKNIVSRKSSGRNINNISDLSYSNNISAEDLHQELINKGKTYNQRTVDADLLDRWNIKNANEPIIFYFGKFLQTKGIGELLTTAPSIIAKNPKVKFIFSGFGTYREHMEQLLDAFCEGNLEKAIKIGKAGNFISELNIEEYFFKISPKIRNRIIITGFLNHDLLSQILPLASICVVPSKLSEAFGMVAVEAMACGVVPICNNHSGLKDILETLKQNCPELASITVTDKNLFFDKLPETIDNTLNFIHPNGYEDFSKIDSLRKQLRKIAVENYSWDKIAENLLY
jgi:glycosyltransferase involved in cell wall biosynthesis